MKIVIFHNGSLGTQIVDTWYKRFSTTSQFQFVYNGSLDNLEELNPKLVVLASDTSSEFEGQVLGRCRELKLTVLPVLGRGSTVLVGPLETPGVPGCVTCLQLRWENTFHQSLLGSLFGNGDASNTGVPLEISQADVLTLSDIVIDEMQSITGESPNPPHCRGQVGIYSDDGPFEWVSILPSHDCPRCDLMPDDDPCLAEVHFDAHILNDGDSLRVASVDFKRLETLYMHTRVGYISATNEIWNGNRYAQADAYIYTPKGYEVAGYGSGLSMAEAKASAMLEVLERSCGVQAVNRRPVVFGTYAEFADIAVHPLQFGLHNDEGLQPYHHIFDKFDEEKKYSWVFAYSTRQKKSVLIPEQIAYYGPTADEKRFITESSNGCAIGGTLEEAALHGLFEVLERDGFLNMWYAKMPVPELKLGRHCPPRITEMFHFLTENGFQVRLFNLSHDLDIPVIGAVAINRKDVYPKVVSGSACHLNPYQAVRGALRELTVQVMNLQRTANERYEWALSMFSDPTKMKDILDHGAVASLPEAYPRWHFLLHHRHRRPILSVEEAYKGVKRRYQVNSRDTLRILGSVLQDLHGRGFDVIVLNQTSVELLYGGLHAVKVFVPGMTPIAWGYGFDRVRGLKRLFELPSQLGYASRVLTEQDLNPHPHPFS